MSSSLPPFVVVTGAAGWLGRRLVHCLVTGLPDRPDLHDPGVRVRALTFPGEDAGPLLALGDRVDVLEGDLRDPAVCARLTEDAQGAVLYHAAGIIHPRRSRDFVDINVGGTKNLLDAAATARVRRAVVVSSNSPMGTNAHPNDVFDESSAYSPYMGYGRSKMQMELYVRELQSRGAIETVVVRPPWFYGPFQPPRQTLFFEMVRDGKGPVVGSGENKRSMAYIDNLCQGLILAATTARAAGETYWIADERPYSMNEILDTVERLLEQEFKIPCAHKRLRLPSLASEAAYVVDGLLQSLGMYNQKIHVLSEMNKTIACSIDKAKRDLGYRPGVALEEGMRRSLSWCVKQGLLRPKP
jgi:nucleoside-diphosphate-sugar epimerase